MVTGLRMNGLKILATCCALMVTAPLSLTADDRIFCKSPDGKFALRTTFTEFVPSHGDAAIIETGTNKVAVQVHGDVGSRQREVGLVERFAAGGKLSRR